MNRFFLLLGGSLLLTSPARAQAGVQVGGNLGSFRAPTAIDVQTSARALPGYHLGVFYHLALSPRLALVPQVQYSRERLDLTQVSPGLVDGGYQATYRERFSYLNVPVLLRLSCGAFYVEAGPQAGYLLGGRETGRVEYTGFTRTAPYEVDRTVVGRYRRVDVGPSVGVGLQLPAGVGLAVRAYHGLVSLAPAGEAPLYRQSLLAGLTYRLARR